MTHRATSVYSFRDGHSLASFADPLVIPVDAGRYRRHDALAFGIQLVERFPVGGRAIVRYLLFGLHLLFLFGQRGLGGLYVLLQRLGFGHQLQDAIFLTPDFLLAKLDLTLKGTVDLVRFGVEHLTFQFGDLLFLDLDFAFGFFTILLVGG